MSLALAGATIYASPDDDPIVDGVVVVEGSRIANAGPRGTPIPRTARVIDCSGLSLCAGFWNSHVHFFERKWSGAATMPARELESHLAAFVRYGFTSVVDLSSSLENTQALRARIASGHVNGPRIRTTGEGLVPPKALPADSVLEAMGLMKTPLPEVRDPREAKAAAKALLQRGADAIKLFASGAGAGALSVQTMRAAVEAAHARGKRVFVHPNTSAEIERALDAGADAIAHTTPRAPWDASLLARIERQTPALTPTLMLWKDDGKAAAAQLRTWIARGGIVLFGTDAGAVDLDPAEEYALMAEAGMTFSDVLASLTTAPARFFGEAGALGRIAWGSTADLVAFEGDPTADIRALSRVRYTVQNGTLLN